VSFAVDQNFFKKGGKMAVKAVVIFVALIVVCCIVAQLPIEHIPIILGWLFLIVLCVMFLVFYIKQLR
jgi:hypothetical protein